MSSQAQLEAQLAQLNEQFKVEQALLNEAQEANDVQKIASLTQDLNSTQTEINAVQAQLNNLTTVTTQDDPALAQQQINQNLQEVQTTGTIAPVSISSPYNAEALQEVTPTSQLVPVQVTSTKRGLQAGKQDAASQPAQSDALNAALKGDWRVKLSLAPGAKYLYMAEDAGILGPLKSTGGIVFPYTPQISVSYAATYESTPVQHSNFKIYQYQNSAVENLQITCDFTAQSTLEANYVLAVIHFLRSVTKMFYGLDNDPIRGTPPPVCYLTGLGQYQFNAHPLVITNFQYSLPNDVDYIRAVAPASLNTEGNSQGTTPKPLSTNTQTDRINSSPTPAGIGGKPNPPALSLNGSPGSTPPTYVPTKMQIVISANPIVTRNTISNDFSLKQYAKGDLLLAKYNKSQGGIW